jgi:anthranilate synthase component I
VLDEAWRSSTPVVKEESNSPPFRGGWFLYLGYELAAEIEPRLDLPMPADGLPVALALRCPVVVVVDHLQDLTTLVAETGYEHLLEQVASDLEDSLGWQSTPIMVIGVEEDPPQTFLDGVAATHAYLCAGDVFQVNLSREWRVTLAGGISPASVYAALREANPAPFAGLLQTPEWAIASSSPERLVQTRGNVVQTRPIAGTRPRLQGDDALAKISELIGHPKERAEHVMLIDLERNDLGRVCVPGSVIVDELMGVESYAHVHHIVSNVHGRLRTGTTPGDVIRAVFPGGTITGCPKVRCMQIIAELEQVPRGAYTGAFGYLDTSGDLDLNILIRTLTMSASNIRLRAGAGIVVDSDADSELAETRDKARGLLRAFGLDG